MISYHERGYRWSLDYVPIYREALGLTQRDVLRAAFPENGEASNGALLRPTWDEYIDDDPILDSDMKEALKRMVLLLQKAALGGREPPRPV